MMMMMMPSSDENTKRDSIGNVVELCMLCCAVYSIRYARTKTSCCIAVVYACVIKWQLNG